MTDADKRARAEAILRKLWGYDEHADHRSFDLDIAILLAFAAECEQKAIAEERARCIAICEEMVPFCCQRPIQDGYGPPECCGQPDHREKTAKECAEAIEETK